MDRLCRVAFEGMDKKYVEFPSVEGIVSESSLTGEYSTNSRSYRYHLMLGLEGDANTYRFNSLQARIDVGERIRLYYTGRMIVHDGEGKLRTEMAGLEVLADDGSAKFRVKMAELDKFIEPTQT